MGDIERDEMLRRRERVEKKRQKGKIPQHEAADVLDIYGGEDDDLPEPFAQISCAPEPASERLRITYQPKSADILYDHFPESLPAPQPLKTGKRKRKGKSADVVKLPTIRNRRVKS